MTEEIHPTEDRQDMKLPPLVLTTAFALCGAHLLAGCTIQGTPQKAADSGVASEELISDLSYVWSAEPGIELTSGPSVAVRAYVESLERVQQTGDIDNFYPGFQTAVAPNAPEGGPRDAIGLWPDTDHAASSPRVGTSKEHILNITTQGDSVTVVVCGWYYGTALRVSEDSYAFNPNNASPPAETAGISAMRVTLARTNGNPTPDLPPQAGSASQPSDNVFGQWRITGKLAGLGTTSRGLELWPTYPQDEAQCIAKAPDPVERRAFLTSGEHPRSDFPTLPASPGWPET
ncbi:hypothetical protein [Mycolicibacterium goodii]|uniref:hypothetical protein n=1 Tax=Mycolicibacterium goodii TaxID=134601 RepID=UPI0012FF9F5A